MAAGAPILRLMARRADPMPDRDDQVKELLLAALEQPDDVRGAFLQQACTGDEPLRLEVQGLLQALAQASGFLADAPPRAIAQEGPGTVLGRYRLVERLGEGGFGVVFRAEQLEPMRRDVALKVLKLGMDTRAVVARFEQEQQALARMQHPHIATVFDGGSTPSGRPYFVMELVAGLPIDRYCNEHGLGIEERLMLHAQVCVAVQHAHHKGVVHRDLKPGNILVTTAADGTPTPKVIDFGIAKATLPDDDGSRLLTAAGEPLGTLEYMAPEQTAVRGDVDARADIYSLGVVLYELLCGRRPFERADEPKAGIDAVLQRVRDEEPLRPSALLARRGARAPLVGADPSRWARRLRGDLDWICARALAKEPARRYATANDLAADLQRHLEGLPVSAGPPTAGYQVRCFVGRHLLGVGAAVLVVLALVAGVVATGAALADARAEAQQKRRTLAAMRQLLLAADPGRLKGPDYTVRQMLDDFANDLDRRVGDDPSVQAELHLTVGSAYRALGQFVAAERHVAKALAHAREHPAAAGCDRVLFEWSAIQRELGRIGEALAAIESLLRGSAPGGAGEIEPVRLWLAKAELLRLMGDLAASEALARSALDRLPADDRAGAALELRATALEQIAFCAGAKGDEKAALAGNMEVLALRERRHGTSHPALAISWLNIAEYQRRLGRPDQAETAASRALQIQTGALGEWHPELAQAWSLRGDLALHAGRLDDAEAHYRHAQAIRERSLPSDHVELAGGPSDLARVAMARQRHDVALPLLQQALAIHERDESLASQSFASTLQNLGVAFAALGRHAEAEQCDRRALAMHRQLGGDSQPAVADCLQNIALACVALGRPTEGIELHEQALQLRRQHRPDDLRQQVMSLVGIANAALAAADPATAARACAERAELMERLPDESAQRIAAVRSLAGRCWLDAGDAVAATSPLEWALSVCEQEVPGRWPHGEVTSLLAECRLAAGATAEALRLAELGAQLLDGSPAAADKQQRARDVLARVRAVIEREGVPR